MAYEDLQIEEFPSPHELMTASPETAGNYVHTNEPELVIQAALDRRAEIRLPAKNELFLDIDTPEALATYEKHLKILNSFNTLGGYTTLFTETERIPSRTPGHYHIVVTVFGTDFTAETNGIESRVALQAILGSDLTRECLSMGSYIKNREATHANVLFKYATEGE